MLHFFTTKKRALTEGSVRGEIKQGRRNKPSSPPPSPTPIIEEGKVVKGGVNERPRTERPSPPKGQGAPNLNLVCVSGSNYVISKIYIKLSEPIPMESDTLNGQWVECKELL